MKNIVKSCAAILLATGANLTFAETLKFEMKFPATSATSYYPGLDLSQLQKIDITVDRDILNPQDTIQYLKLDFNNATDLAVANLSFDQNANRYVGIINGAWVYRKLGIEVDAQPQIMADQPVSVRLFVIEQQSNVNDPVMSYGPDLVVANGSLFDVTPNWVADSLNVRVDDKNLNLKLYKRAERVTQPTYSGEGFRIDARWFGNGDRTFTIPTPFDVNDSNFKAVGLELESYTLPEGQVEHLIAVTYEDLAGSRQTTPFEPLKPLLDQVYPPAQ